MQSDADIAYEELQDQLLTLTASVPRAPGRPHLIGGDVFRLVGMPWRLAFSVIYRRAAALVAGLFRLLFGGIEDGGDIEEGFGIRRARARGAAPPPESKHTIAIIMSPIAPAAPPRLLAIT